MKKKIGRPLSYKSSYPDELIKFFSVEPYFDKPLNHYDKNGGIRWTDYKRVANRLPTLITFAQHLGVDVRTVYRWIEEKSDTYQEKFSQAFIRAKELQKYFLIENGLNGCYNPIFSIFVAKNITDMKDESKIDHTSLGERIQRFVYEKPARDNSGDPANNQAGPGVPEATG